jgi:hypothetical protein
MTYSIQQEAQTAVPYETGQLKGEARDLPMSRRLTASVTVTNAEKRGEQEWVHSDRPTRTFSESQGFL